LLDTFDVGGSHVPFSENVLQVANTPGCFLLMPISSKNHFWTCLADLDERSATILDNSPLYQNHTYTLDALAKIDKELNTPIFDEAWKVDSIY
jgi:hypothetical protein